MYKNPLNNGDLSDYNSLKKQMDYGVRIKKYEKVKLKTKPTELQKYYQYLTYQQPILDDANYIAERMKNEDIKKQKENFEFIQKLKDQKETQLKGIANKEKDLTSELKNELFDEPRQLIDMTPTINTILEMTTNDDDNISNIPTGSNEAIFELSRTEEKKAMKEAIKAAREEAKAIAKEAEKEAKEIQKEIEKEKAAMSKTKPKKKK